MTDASPVTVRCEDSIGSAFERLRAGGRGVVVVVGTDGEVLGTVTDAAIRRAVAAGNDLGAPVERIMSRTPVLADAHATNEEVIGLLRKHRLRSIPRVADGRFAGVSS